jgi:DNA-binding protein H-NS
MAQATKPVEYEIRNGITATPPSSDPAQNLPVTPPPLPEQNLTKDQLDILIRLIIGTGLIGAEELGQYLQQWEENARHHAATMDAPEETKAAVVRYAVLGALFELKDKVELGLENLVETAVTISQTVSQKSQPVTKSRFYQPIQKKYDELVAFGEAKLNPLVERGRREDPVARALAREALGESIDEVIEFLAENEEITELIQQQSLGMANEVVEDVRTRTVTADNVMERITRNLLRKSQREELPPPSPAVQAQAIRLERQAKPED